VTRTRVLIAIGVVAAAVVGVAAFVLWPRGTSEVSRDDALEDFRERGTTGSEPAPEGSELPAPGVYEFAASGQEVVKLGPLPAQTRPLSDRITAVVVDAGDGCFEWTVNLFVEHTEDTRFCVDDGVLRLDEHVKHQQIAALSPTGTMTCDPDVLRDGEADELDLECTLSIDGGPAAIEASLAGTATVGEAGTVDVGGEAVAATPVTVRYDVSGDLTGTWEETTWWSESHLPLRIERSLDLSGLASFTEDSELTITSLEPST